VKSLEELEKNKEETHSTKLKIDEQV